MGSSGVIAKKTVLVLGAGASNHLEYPLGEQIIDEVWNIKHLSKDRIERQPLWRDLINHWGSEKFNAFATRLRKAQIPSIDAFLGRFPEFSEIGRSFLAAILKGRESYRRLFGQSWYRHLLYSLMDDDRYEPVNLSILTFNYDRSLEAYLFETFKNHYIDVDDAGAKEMLKRIPIVHLHGTLGNFPEVEYSAESSVEEILAISKRIKIITEINDAEDDNDFATANSMLQAAERVIFLGFGFHQDNLRRLKFDFSKIWERGGEVIAATQTSSQSARVDMQLRVNQFRFPELSKWCHNMSCNRLFEDMVSLVR
jgi:hypothetical protein